LSQHFRKSPDTYSPTLNITLSSPQRDFLGQPVPQSKQPVLGIYKLEIQRV
jgi:hypothetical protein